MNKTFTLSIWRLWGITILYAIASLFLFVITSGGWTMIMILLYGGIFFATIIALLGIVAGIKAASRHTIVSISKKFLYWTLFLQGLLMIFNGGDCGDGEGSYFFIMRIFSQSSLCNANAVFTNASPLFLTVFLGYVVYGIFLVITLCSIRTVVQQPTNIQA